MRAINGSLHTSTRRWSERARGKGPARFDLLVCLNIAYLALPGEPIPRKRTQWTRRKWLKDNYGAYLQLEGKHKQKLINVRFRGFEDKKKHFHPRAQ